MANVDVGTIHHLMNSQVGWPNDKFRYPSASMMQSGQMERYVTKLDFPEMFGVPFPFLNATQPLGKSPTVHGKLKKTPPAIWVEWCFLTWIIGHWGSFLWNKNIHRRLFQILEGWSALEALYLFDELAANHQECYYRILLRLSNISTDKNRSTACVR